MDPNSDYFTPAPSVLPCDCALFVENKALYVNKQYLMQQSDAFKDLFTKVEWKSQNQIHLDGVTYDEFKALLNAMCWPLKLKLNGNKVDTVLKMSIIFKVKSVEKACESYLLSEHDSNDFLKVQMAQKYDLNHLLMVCLDKYDSMEQLEDAGLYQYLNSTSKNIAFNKFLEKQTKQ
ncbi:BTB/POZ domain-containing protein [Ditylenchus destructor]|uniref:BTB/POZ domain-containing protein n=1 Tax=Ditylenchus destructor TaxID=166010 RepID=A0AAD4N953_9BILA|nr:BTB/POZ domain-containing protein [Ditylenchus destructor]